MSKTAVQICLFLLIAGAHLGNSIKFDEKDLQKLRFAAEEVLTAIDKALTELEDYIENFKKSTWSHVHLFKTEASEKISKFRNHVDDMTLKFSTDLGKLIKIDLNQLTCDLVENFRKQAFNVFDNVQTCVNDTFSKVIDRVEYISNTGTKVRYALQASRKDVIACKKNAADLKSGIACIKKVKSGAKVVVDSIPGVAVKFMEVGILVTTLKPNLEFCTSKVSFDAIRKHYSTLLIEFPKCVTTNVIDKISNFWNRKTSKLWGKTEEKREQITIPVREVVTELEKSHPKYIIKNIYD